MKQTLCSLVCLSIFSVICAGCTTSPSPADQTAQQSSKEISEVSDHKVIPIKIGDKTFSVEAVVSIESIIKGLGERDQIGSDGMLFFMPDRSVAQFWMHGMRFPLDFIWIDESTIVGIEKNVPAPKDPTSTNLPSYSSKVPVTQVLEIPAGKSDELGITVGMPITY